MPAHCRRQPARGPAGSAADVTSLRRHDGVHRRPAELDQGTGGAGPGLGPDGAIPRCARSFAATDPTLMMALVEEALDPSGPTAFVMRSLLFAGIANQRADVITTGDARGTFPFSTTSGDLAGEVPDTPRGLPVLKSTQISKTRTKGSGTGLTYVVCGNFRNLLVGRYGAVEIAASQDLAFHANKMAVRAEDSRHQSPPRPRAPFPAPAPRPSRPQRRMPHPRWSRRHRG